MKILILGANGRTGRRIVDECIKRNHEVHALVRMADSLAPANGLRIFEGSCLDYKTLDRALTGTQAVVCTLNISRQSDFPWARLKAPKTLISDTIAMLIPLMHAHGISRIITVSASGVGDSEGQLPGWFRWLIRNSNIMYGYEDHARQEKILSNSDLEWTILRPVGLTNSEKNASVHLCRAAEKPSSMMIPRQAVASFIVEALEQHKLIQETVTISVA